MDEGARAAPDRTRRDGDARPRRSGHMAGRGCRVIVARAGLVVVLDRAGRRRWRGGGGSESSRDRGPRPRGQTLLVAAWRALVAAGPL